MPVPLLPKPKGGHRPIGVFTSPYRLWVKARRPLADAWEARNDRSFWASGKARSAQDVVWRQAVRAEVRGASSSHAATLLWDAEAFFERVCHRKLVARARRTGYPMQLLRPAIAMYRAPRLITMGGHVARELMPRRGVVAGCGYATTLMKVYCLEPFDDYIKKEGDEGGDFDAYIDDFAITIEGETITDVVERMDTAQQALKEVIEVDLEAVVAVGKAGLITTSEELARRLRARIGPLAGEEGVHAANLGHDLLGGRRRTKKRKKARRRRVLGAFARRHRIASLAGVLSRRQLRAVYTAGVAPAADYEAAVNGLADDEVLLLRRTASAAMAPRGRGRSLTMALLLAGLPTWCSELAPALQYSRAVWRASTGATRGNDLDLAELARVWAELDEQRYADKLLRPKSGTAYGAGGASARQWSACRGPVGAMILALDRIRWRAKDAFTLVDDWDEEIQLTTTSPSLLKTLLKEAAQREAQRKIASTWAEENSNFTNRRVCTDVVEGVLKSDARLTRLEKGALASTVANAVWTRDRAYHAGYDVVNRCPRCGAEGDTAHHRVWHCPATASAREKLPPWIIAEARSATPTSRFWTTGAFPHPGDICPRPPSKLMAECVDGDGADIVDIKNWGIEGLVYTDGSCTRKVVRELQRAACAVVVTDGDGKPIKTIRAVVPSPLPQSPQAAEFVGFMIAFRLLRDVATVHSDCKNVVETINAGFPTAMSPKRAYAGLVRDMLKWPQQRAHMQELRKVKAHQSICTLTDPEEILAARGNAAADENAKKAIEMHPTPSRQADDEVQYWLDRAELVATTTARAMALFPPMGKRLTKIRPGSIRSGGAARESAPARENGAVLTSAPLVHEWRHEGGKWRCRVCTRMCCDDHLPPHLIHQKCGGPRTQTSAEAMADRGHVLGIAAAHVPFVLCLRCGAYAVRRVYAKLRGTCVEATMKGRQSIARLHRGLPPWDVVGRAAVLGTTASLRGIWDKDHGWVGIATGPRQYLQDGEEDVEHDAPRERWTSPAPAGEVEVKMRVAPTAAQIRLAAVKRRVLSKVAAASAAEATQLDVMTATARSAKRAASVDEDQPEGDLTPRLARRRVASGCPTCPAEDRDGAANDVQEIQGAVDGKRGIEHLLTSDSGGAGSSTDPIPRAPPCKAHRGEASAPARRDGRGGSATRKRKRPSSEAQRTHAREEADAGDDPRASCYETNGSESGGNAEDSGERGSGIEREEMPATAGSGDEAQRGEGGEAAPPTPIATSPPQRTAEGVWVTRGCGCNGRIHQQCTRRKVPKRTRERERGGVVEEGPQ